MTQTINTLNDAPGVIAKMAAAMLESKVQFTKTIAKVDEQELRGKNGYDSGDTIYINKPARFIPSDNADITSSIQDVVEEKVPLTLNTRKVVPIALTSAEIATDLSLKSWAKRILEPAVSSMAQYIDAAFAEQAMDATYNAIGGAGAPGTTTFDTLLVGSARRRINEMACPDLQNRYALLSSSAMLSAVNARKGQFQASDEISKQYVNGYMGKGDGFTYVESDLLPSHTMGNDVVFEVRTTVTTEGATQIVVEGLTANTGTVKKGTVFTVAGVNAVHPITKRDLGYLQQFTVLNDETADASGYATLDVSPAIYTAASGGLQNVTAFPADGSACTPVGSASSTYAQSILYHKNAFMMMSAPLFLPGGTDMAAQETKEGLTIRVIRDYTILSDKLIMRLDFLGGLCAARPEWAVKAFE